MGNGNLPDNVTDRDIEEAFGGVGYVEPYDIEIKYGKQWDYLGQANTWGDMEFIHRWLTTNGNQVRVTDENGREVEL